MSLRIFSPHTHNVTCCRLHVALCMRHWHARRQPRIVTEVACDGCRVFNCLVNKNNECFHSLVLVCKEFGRASGSADLKSVSLVLPSAKTHSFFSFFLNTDDVKLLKLVIKSCSVNSLCQNMIAICECFHTSEFVWKLGGSFFSCSWLKRVYMSRLWSVFFCALASSGLCQPPAATRFPSWDAKETSGFSQCGQHIGEASALQACWGTCPFGFCVRKLHQIWFTKCNLISVYSQFYHPRKYTI